MRFPDQLIGQPLAGAILDRALRNRRIAHAYLFHGPEGVGKRTAARLFAAAATCRSSPAAGASPPETGPFPCGECESCRLLAAGTHPDVLEVHADTETGQNISVRLATAIVANVALRPRSGPRRFFIIPRAQLLGDDSANTLLKTLEEPGESTTLILCAPALDGVLPTVVSRCQPVRFDLVPTGVIEAALRQLPGIDPATALAAAVASGGRPGVALAAAADPALPEQAAQVRGLFLDALRTRGRTRTDPAAGIAALRLAEQLRRFAQARREGDLEAAKNGPEGGGGVGPLKHYLADLLRVGESAIRDILVLGAGGASRWVQNPDCLADLEALSREIVPTDSLQLLRLFGETGQLLERNVAPQLALERLFLNVCMVTATG